MLTAGGGTVMENSDWPENAAADLFIQQPLNQSQHSAIIDMNDCLLQVWQQQQQQWRPRRHLPHPLSFNIGVFVCACFMCLVHLVI